MPNVLPHFLLTGIRQAARDILDLIYPPCCLVCDETCEPGPDTPGGEAARFLCPSCQALLAADPDTQCQYCGGSLSTVGVRPQRCICCQNERFQFERAIVLGPYRDALRRMIIDGKFKNKPLLPLVLARLLWSLHREDLEQVACDLVVPVPMYWIRRWIRGLNGPEMMARYYAHQLGIPCLHSLLVRSRSTRAQSSLLVGRERYRNVADAFAIREGRGHSIDAIQGRRILLVDDVLTTGATCNELSRILLGAGASGIVVTTLARTEGHENQF